MMNLLKLALIGLALGSTASIADECTAPTVPTLPDGATASMEQMLKGQEAVKAYQTVNTEYRTCLEPKITTAEDAAAGDSPGPELQETLKQLNEEYNASVSKEEELADKFNKERSAYMDANND